MKLANETVQIELKNGTVVQGTISGDFGATPHTSAGQLVTKLRCWQVWTLR
jgi:hypothetical protein